VKRKFCYDYPRPMVTVDVVAICRMKRKPHVLLIKRKKAPFKGKWALPGGFVGMDEPLEEAARRELEEETGVPVQKLKQIGAFGDPKRDPRGRVITVAYLARVPVKAAQTRADDDAAEARWFPLDDLPPLAFDHAIIISTALRGKSPEDRAER